MSASELNCDQLMTWWEPKADIAFIFSFNWKTVGQLREAITMFLSARLHALACQASRMLTDNGSHRTKLLLASNPESPCELLEYLTYIGEADVALRVAENSSTNSRTLERLSCSPSPAIRGAVADNSNTPESCLLKLARDEDPDVRYCLAENPNLPVSVLYVLIQDENPYVSLRTRKTLSRLLSNAILTSEQHVEENSPARLEHQAYDGMFAREVVAELQAMYDSYQAHGTPGCQHTS